MSSIGLREVFLGGLGALSVGALAYGAAAGNTWVLVAGNLRRGGRAHRLVGGQKASPPLG